MTCPVCKSANSEDAVTCGSCGRRLEAGTLALRREHEPGTRSFPSGTGASAATAAAPAQSTSTQLAPGQMLGTRYRIQAEAGHGGMGRVYRAIDVELNRTVALKVIRDELAHDSATIARLKDEIRLASEISHAHVLRMHDLGEADGIRFVSMAWVDGEDLEHLIRRGGRRSEQEILRVAEQVCEGLEAAHNKQIIHRDLKPQNILLDANGNACVSDFGLAQSLVPGGSEHLTQTGHVVGTPRYMSPEQLQGQSIDGRTDLYSLGLVLYEMATATVPDIRQRLFQKPAGVREVNPAISQKLERVIARCLEIDPAKRYSSASSMLNELHADKTHRRRYEKWIYAAAAAVLIALLATAFGIRRSARTVPRPPSAGKYVAVLPFRVAGSDATLKSYAEGIQEAVSGRLFGLSGVHPISEAAVERANLKQPVEAIARQVGANVVVEGTLEDRDGGIIVHSSVVNVETHNTLSENTFTGAPSTLVAIEDSVYEQVAGSLGERMTPADGQVRPRNPEAYDLYLKGRELLKDKRDADGTAAALNLFEQASTKDPGFAQAWTGVADASLQMYRIKRDGFWAAKALDAAQRAASNANNVPEVYFTLGSVYTATGKNAQAVEELKRALALEPNSDNGYIRLGRAYLATANTDAAVNALKKAVELNPYYWYNHDQLGLAFYKMGRNEEALKEFQTASDLDPDNAAEHNRIGATYWRMSNWQKCVEEWKKVIALQPSADAYTNLGNAYFALGKYREAISHFKKAVLLNNTHVLFALNLGDAYRQAGQQEEATKAYSDAIRLAYQQLQVNPQDAAIMGYLAICYAKRGDTSKALDFIHRARGIDKADNQLMYDEAVIDVLAGKPEDALNPLASALDNGYSLEEAKIDPDLKPLRSIAGFSELISRVQNQAARP